jgi:hypothetical protein
LGELLIQPRPFDTTTNPWNLFPSHFAFVKLNTKTHYFSPNVHQQEPATMQSSLPSLSVVCSSAEAPMKSYIQYLMQQHQTTYFVIDNALTHGATPTPEPEQITPPPPRWDNLDSIQLCPQTPPKRRLSLDLRKSLEERAMERGTKEVDAESIAAKNLRNCPPDCQRVLLAVQQWYASPGCGKTRSAPTAPKRRESVQGEF